MSLQTWLYTLFFVIGGIMGTGHDGNYDLLTVNLTITCFSLLVFGGCFMLIKHVFSEISEKTKKNDFKLLIKVIITLIFGALLGHSMCPL